MSRASGRATDRAVPATGQATLLSAKTAVRHVTVVKKRSYSFIASVLAVSQPRDEGGSL